METDVSEAPEGAAGKVNKALDRWVKRLAANTHQALLLLIGGEHSQKQISLATGVAEPHVSRIRKTYETLSGIALPRPAASNLAA